MSKKITKIDKVRQLLTQNPAMKIDALVNQSGVNRPLIHVYLAKARKELGLKSRQDIVRERKEKIKAIRNKRHHLLKEEKAVLPDLPITMVEPKADLVNHPPHYKVGGIETIDFIEAKKLNYNLGNVVKYVTRADHKGARKQDLEKAVWYLQREISSL
jgi:hypothetical protein